MDIKRWLNSRSDLWGPCFVGACMFAFILCQGIVHCGWGWGWGAECPSIGDNISCGKCHSMALTPECCPPQDLVFQLSNGDYVTIPKGFFDDPDNWVTPEDHKKRIDKLIKDETI